MIPTYQEKYDYVIFNRVPKCASMSMTELSYKLSGDNHFYVESPYEDGEKPEKTESQIQDFYKHLISRPSPDLYIRHQYYIPLTPELKSKTAYINMIRDPIARFESFYYF